MKHLFATALLILCAISLQAQTNVSGTINKDSTWTLAASPYLVTGNVSIADGKVLTVDSGVVVRFADNTGLTVYGSMHARHALFTSQRDTIGGSPSKGNWNHIIIGASSGPSVGTFDTCVIRYGGSASFTSESANLWIYSGSLSVHGCDISFSKNAGIQIGGASGPPTVDISGCAIFSTDWPIRYRYTAFLTLAGINTLTGNTHNAINVNFGDLWHDMTMPKAEIPYVFSGDFTVHDPGARLLVASGNMLKFPSGAALNVEGTLVAEALPAEAILFTSTTDDNAGGDTNADATATTPASSSWRGVMFQNTSVDSLCRMKRAEVRFAGQNGLGGVTLYTASPTIDSCDFNNNWFGAMFQGVSNPVFSNNVIGSSQLTPIAMSFAANPVFTNNAFSLSDNRYDAIGLLGGDLPANAVLPVRSVESIPNVTYLLLESVTVPAGRTLTIHERVVIKGLNDWGYIYGAPRITIQGKLVAVASADSTKIVFTSARDDNYGNPFDTNKDGTSTSPERDDWGGIVFEASSDTTSTLRHCLIKYASMPSTYYNTRWISGGAVTMVNASPVIDNCEIKDVSYGLYAFQVSKPKVSNVAFVNTQYTPIAMSVSADPTLSGISFVNVAWRAIGIIGENVGFNGTIRVRNLAGFSNITYVLLEDLTINSGTQVTVEAGVVVKSNASGIFVNGGFRAKGTMAGGKIVFTSIKDDNFGNPNDTNGDGSTSTPQRGDWKTIRFQGTSDDAFCRIDSCELKYGGSDGGAWGVVSYLDASSTLSNSNISDSYQYGVACDGASMATISNVDIRNCRLDPLAMSLTADPVFSGITFAANRSNGIRILEGTLSSNARLRKRDVAGYNNIAYIVEYLTIGQNAVLTIDPGVVIKLPVGWYYRSITVDGALIANGTALQRITFTSLNDDGDGNDTNNDGNSSTAVKGDWGWIDFTNNSNDTLNSLRNCDFRYGGNSNWWDPSLKNYGMVQIHSARVVVDSCYFQQSSTSALGIYGSADPAVTNCQISNVELSPIMMSLFATPTFSGNLALNVGYMALGIVPETYAVNATIPKRDFGGYTNISYLFMSGDGNNIPTVNSGTVLTIPSGIVIKYWPENSGRAVLNVNGALVVNGTAAEPVIITDPRDDTAGNPGDTNGDGFATSPAITNTVILSFADVSLDSLSIIRHADLRYRDVGIYLQQASPAIVGGRFYRDRWGIMLNGISTPAVDSCAFDDLDLAPINISLVSYPRSTTANTVSGTTYRAIGVLNETLAQDVTLPRRTFAGIPNIPYLLHQYTVGTGAVLTIQPGVTLKFSNDGWLAVRKGLIAEGGAHPDSTIVFTYVRDDFYGGDTNADTAKTVPYDEYFWDSWRGLRFEDEALDPLCRLSHVVVRYAGSYWTDDCGGIMMTSASPSIMYSTISFNKHGLRVLGASNPIVNYSDIANNRVSGISYPAPAFTLDARWNWWGSNSGPTHASNPGGTGDAISNSISYSPFLSSGAANPAAGDVSLNGHVQAFDASLILKYVVNPHGVDSLNALQRRIADVSGNGGPDTVSVTAFDASLILQYVVGIVGAFPIEVDRKELPAAPAKRSVSVTLAAKTVGQTITVPVAIDRAEGLASWQAVVDVDPLAVRTVGVTARGATMDMQLVWAAEGGRLRIAAAASAPTDASGDLAEITLEILDASRLPSGTPVRVASFLINEVEMTSTATGVTTELADVPTAFELLQNYPNPFNPTTTIEFRVPDARAEIRLTIYNMLGQTVRTLVDGPRDVGTHRIVWDGRNDAGVPVGTGTYIYQLRTKDVVQSKKLTLVK